MNSRELKKLKCGDVLSYGPDHTPCAVVLKYDVKERRLDYLQLFNQKTLYNYGDPYVGIQFFTRIPTAKRVNIAFEKRKSDGFIFTFVVRKVNDMWVLTAGCRYLAALTLTKLQTETDDFWRDDHKNIYNSDPHQLMINRETRAICKRLIAKVKRKEK